MSILRLPVSGTDVVLRTPDGADDVFLAELSTRDEAAATAFLSRVARHTDGSIVDWRTLPVADVDVALLDLRRLLVGDFVRTAVRCVSPPCGALFDISFRISDYLRYHQPRRARAAPADEPGWFRLQRSEVFFRLPTAGDLIALANDPDIEGALALRCIRPKPTRAQRRRVETAMQALAPSLYDSVDCDCHECGRAVPLVFNPSAYVLGELRRRATHVYDDVHLLASRYHWSERDILALPQRRRERYAERAHADGGW